MTERKREEKGRKRDNQEVESRDTEEEKEDELNDD